MSRDYAQKLAENIFKYRKIVNLTREVLAVLVDVPVDTVRAWEAGSLLPQADLLPDIARILGVSIELLYGLQREDPAAATVELPWEDDHKLRAVIFKGRQLLRFFDESVRDFSFTYGGEALNVESWCNIYCGVPELCGGSMGIRGNAVAGFNIYCGDIRGSASAGRDINCGHIGQDAAAGRDINCRDADGRLKAGRRQRV